MNRKAILANLKQIELAAAEMVLSEYNHGYNALVVIPDLIREIKEELLPWYSRLWGSLLYLFNVAFHSEDEIPF